ncbi:hypothetical protein K1T71_002431 [Dendrolimus kikuchii]|uniref:Uncharacterized protein n=1 Tax=Dendrolimus kikuchii TaxID=765133 RepID=A0ACC1DCP1_9NEOP|nr:hypothetical protein K1T71_002431 [Dendrolimus kikuchii]
MGRHSFFFNVVVIAKKVVESELLIEADMRRKSERTASKKVKASPEKKIEKPKRGKSRRNKQSTSENESGDERESSPVRETETAKDVEKVEPPAAKEDSPEEAHDQVWQVKTAESSGDGGEIKKLKICLTRPPSTPERADRSPRSKRKLSRATSSSDTPSMEGVDDKKRSKHRTKRMQREPKDDSEKNQDSHGEEQDTESDTQSKQEKTNSNSQKEFANEIVTDENPVSTTNESNKAAEGSSADTSSEMVKSEESTKTSDADTTVVSPDAETTAVSNSETKDTTEPENHQEQSNTTETQVETSSSPKQSPMRPRSMSIDKSEVLEIHADDSKCESSDNEMSKSKEYSTKEESPKSPEPVQESKVSRTEDVSVREEEADNNDIIETINESAVVENSESTIKEARKVSVDSDKYINRPSTPEPEPKSNDLERRDSIQSNQDDVHNGQAAPIHIHRKRRWGSRPAKLTTQKSITISTDVLKDIISDVKPVEFEEVIEDKKHRRVEITEKIERPLLPKIIIDNTENVEQHRKVNNEIEEKDKDRDTVKPKESHLASNRKISIIKDNDSIIARPPSPPRHKPSCILYITNLVRPFTLLQLKNLLQRTGRIAENGFWIDKIKSKCYVKFEKEDQAVETRHALHGVTWPVSNPKTLQVDFSTEEAFEKAKLNEDNENTQKSTIPGTVEDWLREQDLKRERGEVEKPWERKAVMREWDVGKNEKDKDKEKLHRDERPIDKRRNRSPERSPEPARKFKKKEEEAPAKLLDDLFRKTKTTPCIYWLPLSAETIAVKEEQRRQHMAEFERRQQEQRRPHRRH